MNDKSIANQAGVPNQEAVEDQEASIESTNYSGGSALLDAQVQAGQQMGGDPDVENPSATNIAGNTNDPVDANNLRITGDYPVDAEHLGQESTPPPEITNQE